MDNYRLVLPEHLNHGGFLFGGQLLKWADECAWIAASMEYPQCNFVTIGMNDVRFLLSVREGTILRFETTREKVGKSSIHYQLNVFSTANDQLETVFAAKVSFVRLDEQGNKLNLPR